TVEIGIEASAIAEELAAALAAYINNEHYDALEFVTFSGYEASGSALVSATAGGGALTLTSAGNELDYLVSGDIDGDPLNVDTLQVGSSGDFASDILEGGEGSDLYVIGQSQFDTMDTIIGLDLGDGSGEDTQDLLALGALIPPGAYDSLPDFPDDPEAYVVHGLKIEHVVNHGEIVTLTGPTLEAAVDSLFEANGWFEVSGSAATNAAGLFQYGDDTYLIAVGDKSGAFGETDYGFGSDDFMIKV